MGSGKLKQEHIALIGKLKYSKEKFVILSIYWPDSHQYCVLTKEKFIGVLQGKQVIVEGEVYMYDGMEFSTSWYFNGDGDYSDPLEVNYDRTFNEPVDEDSEKEDLNMEIGEDHSGMGYRGEILDAEIELSLMKPRL